MKKIFAADDWGFSPAINEAILEFARRGILRSVSCVANAPYVTYQLDELLAYGEKNNLSFSLHLNFTYGRPLSLGGTFGSHSALLRRCLFGRIDREDVVKEFEAQLMAMRRLGVPV